MPWTDGMKRMTTPCREDKEMCHMFKGNVSFETFFQRTLLTFIKYHFPKWKYYFKNINCLFHLNFTSHPAIIPQKFDHDPLCSCEVFDSIPAIKPSPSVITCWIIFYIRMLYKSNPSQIMLEVWTPGGHSRCFQICKYSRSLFVA